MAKRKNVTDTEKQLVYIRDGFRCRYCGKSQYPWSRPTPHIDHVQSVKNDGLSMPSNYVLSCRACNLKKGTANWQPNEPPLIGVIIYMILVLGRYF